MADLLVQEKIEQAVGIMSELDLDLWLTFFRESTLTPDPCVDLILGFGMTWHSALLVSRTGQRVAIVGRYDAESVKATEAYINVISYDEGIGPALLAQIQEFNPRQIAVNFSPNDPAADGLTHGMYMELERILYGTPYANMLVSAEKLVAALRGRKSPQEVARIRAAIATTEQIYADITAQLAVGQKESDLAERMTAQRKSLGLGTAWEEAYCPMVNNGPESPVGHAGPGEFKAQPGYLLHMDFGVQENGYCSDLQRMWYFLRPGESAAPEEVQKAFDACWAAIDAGAAVLKPGVAGWEVDAAARASLVAAGYPEYRHALGHGLGRVAHDGATLLGPRWDRYGNTPYGIVEAGNVFTLELGVIVPGYGFMGLEEDVLVTEDGIEWLSTPERELWLVKSAD